MRYELNGYPVDVELPDYRVFEGIAGGHFLGRGGSSLRNAVLPAGNLPAEYRDWARKAYFRQPIASLEETANNREHETVHCPWPGDLVAHVQEGFYDHMVLGQAWLSISRTAVVAAVETVRNRILSFALDAEQYIKADDAPPQPEATASLSHVFHYGNVGNVAQGSSSVTQYAGLSPGDLQSLLRELRQAGVQDEDLGSLKAAIEQDGPPQSGKLGARVAAWVGNMVSKAISGTWSVTTSTATTVLPKLIERYYDLGP